MQRGGVLRLLGKVAWIVGFVGTLVLFLAGLSALIFYTAFDPGDLDGRGVGLLVGALVGFAILWASAGRAFPDRWPQ